MKMKENGHKMGTSTQTFADALLHKSKEKPLALDSGAGFLNIVCEIL